MPDTADNNSRVMDALDRIIEIEPSSEALILKGKLLHRKEDYKAAIPVLDQAMLIQPKNEQPKSNCFFYQAMCYEKLKDYKTAMMSYKKCLTLD